MPRWEQRHRAPAIAMPDWSPAAPDRVVFESTESGVWQVHCVDLASGAVLAVTVQPADRGDTKSYAETLDAAQSEAEKAHPLGIEEIVMDKGYHSGAVLVDLAER